MIEQETLPPHTFRKSQRARYLQMRITAAGQLEIVVPKRVSQKQAQAFFLENLAWVKKRLHLLVDQPCSHDKALVFPDTIELRALDFQYRVVYLDRPEKLRLIESQDMLYSNGASAKSDHFFYLLQRWLKRKCSQHLNPWLQALAEEFSFSFSSVSYRGQKTRWGSCSSNGTISLNYKLLFLPKAMVNYVLVHELCHTKHLDHSKRFWHLVECCEPDWRSARAALKNSDQYLPYWLGCLGRNQ